MHEQGGVRPIHQQLDEAAIDETGTDSSICNERGSELPHSQQNVDNLMYFSTEEMLRSKQSHDYPDYFR
ncbi:hypothetical protein KIN20_003813 [Parelaphostrongylus tenuis]|uniref:Uncharacterized protein n=1 Tax=Parelaphostrongylus tenuis TaxID=148309 RepID=A0AAD5LZQ6_PARTN|nr:hypothetical protein KIN20_003813 [Parelaphostrongylus tenuis]